MSVRDLVDGDSVDMVLLVREREVRQKKDGSDYLNLTVSDRTGSTTIKVWDPPVVGDLCPLGEPVRVTGRYTVHPKYGAEIKLGSHGLREPEDEVDWSALLDGPVRPVDLIEADLRRLQLTVEDEHLCNLLHAVFGEDTPTWPLFRDAPGGQKLHHCYRHGLLEHTVQVGQMVSVVAAMTPDINRDVAVTGALLHDIGKLDVYTVDPLAIEFTDTGKLTGEIPLSYYRLRRLLESFPDFPPAAAAAVLHVVLSHHGTPEQGSPVVPLTREALLVHTLDNLSARLGAFDRLEKQQPVGQEWSPYDRMLGGRVYLPTDQADLDRQAELAIPAAEMGWSGAPEPEENNDDLGRQTSLLDG